MQQVVGEKRVLKPAVYENTRVCSIERVFCLGWM